MAGSVGEEINQATRSYHTTLNQLILQCLPMALPPHTSSHHLYALGISHFYPIYSTFEFSFRDHMRSNNAPAMLQQLHLAELERAQALEDDIGLLLPSSYRDPSAENVPCLRSFERHIKDSLAKKPHLLVAYTWIFYMALFSGGRYIRAKLRAGLDSFIASIEVGKTTGLTFWEFPGEKDGEDLKVEYKKRVSALSAQLTDEERAEIVEESIHIMTTLTNVVREVAEIVPSRAIALSLEAPAGGIHGPVARIRPPWLLLLGILFPFGIMEIMFAALGSWKSQAPEQGVVAPMPAPLKAE